MPDGIYDFTAEGDAVVHGSTIPDPVSPSPVTRKPLAKRTPAAPVSDVYDFTQDAQAPTDEAAAAPAPVSSGLAPEGAVKSFARAAIPKIIPGLMGFGGAVAGGAAGALVPGAEPVTIPAGAIAGGIAAESQGGKVNKWLSERLFTPDHIASYNAQLEANAAARPLTTAAGEMAGGVGSMFAGGGTAKAIPKLVRAAKLSEEAIAAGKTAAEAKQVYDKAAGGAKVGGALLESGVAGAVMTGGSAAQNPDATLYSTTKAAVQGGVTMAPLAFVPHAKSILGAVGWRAPTDAAILTVNNALYDHFVNGKALDPAEISGQIGKDIPSFMLMNGIMSVFGRMPLLPHATKTLAEAKTPADVLANPGDVHTVLAQAADAPVEPVAETVVAEPVKRRRPTKKIAQQAQEPPASEPAAVVPPQAETPAVEARGEPATPGEKIMGPVVDFDGVQYVGPGEGKPSTHDNIVAEANRNGAGIPSDNEQYRKFDAIAPDNSKRLVDRKTAAEIETANGGKVSKQGELHSEDLIRNRKSVKPLAAQELSQQGDEAAIHGQADAKEVRGRDADRKEVAEAGTPEAGEKAREPVVFKKKMFQGRGAKPEDVYGPDAVKEGRAVPLLGKADYFTESEQDAKNYGEVSQHDVELKNPYIIDSDKTWRKLLQDSGATALDSRNEEFYDHPERIAPHTEKAQAYLKSRGHDGVVVSIPRHADMNESGDSIKSIRESFGHSQVVRFGQVAAEPSKPAAEAPRVAPEPAPREAPAGDGRAAVAEAAKAEAGEAPKAQRKKLTKRTEPERDYQISVTGPNGKRIVSTVKGRAISIPEAPWADSLFIHKADREKGWVVSDAATGMSLTRTAFPKQENAVEWLNDFLPKIGKEAFEKKQRENAIPSTDAKGRTTEQPDPAEPPAATRKPIVAKSKAAKQPWEMTRAEYTESAASKFTLPRGFAILDAIEKSNNRNPYEPGLLHPDGIESVQELGLVTGGKKLRLTTEGRNALDEGRRIERDRRLSSGSASDEHVALVESAIYAGRDVPAAVLADYPELAKKPATETTTQGVKVEAAPSGDKTISVPSKDVNGLPPKEQKKYLLAEIDKAIEGAPFKDSLPKDQQDAFKRYEKVSKTSGVFAERFQSEFRAFKEAVKDIQKITIEVPGDGTFEVLNVKESLDQFRKRANSRFPTGESKKGLEDKLGKAPEGWKPWQEPAKTAPKNMAGETRRPIAKRTEPRKADAADSDVTKNSFFDLFRKNKTQQTNGVSDATRDQQRSRAGWQQVSNQISDELEREIRSYPGGPGLPQNITGGMGQGNRFTIDRAAMASRPMEEAWREAGRSNFRIVATGSVRGSFANITRRIIFIQSQNGVVSERAVQHELSHAREDVKEPRTVQLLDLVDMKSHAVISMVNRMRDLQPDMYRKNQQDALAQAGGSRELAKKILADTMAGEIVAMHMDGNQNIRGMFKDQQRADELKRDIQSDAANPHETPRGTAMYELPTKLTRGDYDERDIRDQINRQNPPADWKGDDGNRRGRELASIRGLQQELGEGAHAAQVTSVVHSDAFSRSRRFGALAEIARRNGVEAVPVKGDNGQLPFNVGDQVFLPDTKEQSNAAIHEIGHVLDRKGVPEIRAFIAAVNRGSEYFTGTYRAVQEHPFFGPAYRENARKELGLDANKELSEQEQMMVDDHVGNTVAADIALNNLTGKNTWDAISPKDIGLRGAALKRVMDGETGRGTAMYARGDKIPTRLQQGDYNAGHIRDFLESGLYARDGWETGIHDTNRQRRESFDSWRKAAIGEDSSGVQGQGIQLSFADGFGSGSRFAKLSELAKQNGVELFPATGIPNDAAGMTDGKVILLHPDSSRSHAMIHELGHVAEIRGEPEINRLVDAVNTRSSDFLRGWNIARHDPKRWNVLSQQAVNQLDMTAEEANNPSNRAKIDGEIVKILSSEHAMNYLSGVDQGNVFGESAKPIRAAALKRILEGRKAARGVTGPGLSRPDFDAALAEETKGMKFAGENVTSGVSGEAPEWAKAAEGQAAKAEALPKDEDVIESEDYTKRMFDSMRDWRNNANPLPSRENPTPPMGLRLGMWRRDSMGLSHGHEMSQLRLVDPRTLSLSENMVENNEEGRGWDADRYAKWFKEGKAPPPIEVVETDSGKLQVVNGHRRTAAAKQNGQPVLAWVSPAMDIPERRPDGARYHYDGDTTKPIIKTGLTYEAWRDGKAERTGPLTGSFMETGAEYPEGFPRFFRSDSGQIRALTIGNKSHFFLDRYDNADQLRQDIREEAMHRVVNELGGPAWQKAASQVYGGTRAAMIAAEIKRNYGFKPGTEAFNHELLAKMVRDGQQNAGAWRRTVDAVVSMLRDAGRRLGLDLNMSDAELRNLANGILREKERQMAGELEDNPSDAMGQEQPTSSARAARGERDPDADRTATRALSAVRTSPGEYKNLMSWTKQNYGSQYEPGLSDHENAARVLAGIDKRPDNLRGVAGVAFQRFKTAIGKGGGSEPMQAARADAEEIGKAKEEGFGVGPVMHGSPVGGLTTFTTGKAGVFFTDSADLAKEYTWNRSFYRTPSKTGTVYQAMLSIKNPLEIDAMGTRNDNIPVPWQTWKQKVFGAIPKNAMSVEKIMEYAKSKGHDGVVIRNVVDTADPSVRGKPSTVYGVVSHEQVKMIPSGVDGRADDTPRQREMDKAISEVYPDTNKPLTASAIREYDAAHEGETQPAEQTAPGASDTGRLIYPTVPEAEYNDLDRSRFAPLSYQPRTASGDAAGSPIVSTFEPVEHSLRPAVTPEEAKKIEQAGDAILAHNERVNTADEKASDADELGNIYAEYDIPTVDSGKFTPASDTLHNIKFIDELHKIDPALARRLVDMAYEKPVRQTPRSLMLAEDGIEDHKDLTGEITVAEKPTAPTVDGSTWRDVRRDPGKDFSIREEPAYKSEADFLADFKEHGEHDAGERIEEFLKRRFCGGRGA